MARTRIYDRKIAIKRHCNSDISSASKTRASLCFRIQNNVRMCAKLAVVVSGSEVAKRRVSCPQHTALMTFIAFCKRAIDLYANDK